MLVEGPGQGDHGHHGLARSSTTQSGEHKLSAAPLIVDLSGQQDPTGASAHLPVLPQGAGRRIDIRTESLTH